MPSDLDRLTVGTVTACMFLFGYWWLFKRRARGMRRRYWVHPMNQTRNDTGVFAGRIRQLRHFDDRYSSYFRMSPQTFDHLLSLIKSRITRQDTFMRLAIEPELRLAITLHHLAEGSSHSSIAIHYGLGRSTVSGIVYDTCEAIWTVLQPTYMRLPSGPQEWSAVSEQFLHKWDFPNCIGAVDGKHVQVKSPPNTHSEYFNYKKTFSINLMAVVDAEYRFLMIDVGQKGSVSDGGVWEASTFGSAFARGEVNVPPPSKLPGTDIELPHVLVADEAFPLRVNMLRPYPGRDLETMVKKRYNYRLSRARRVVENAFGILCQRWRIFFQPLQADENKAAILVKAACVLHNYLSYTNDNTYIPAGYADQRRENGEILLGGWRIAGRATGMSAATGRYRNHPADASTVREQFAAYFSSETGSRPWQDEQLMRR